MASIVTNLATACLCWPGVQEKCKVHFSKPQGGLGRRSREPRKNCKVDPFASKKVSRKDAKKKEKDQRAETLSSGDAEFGEEGKEVNASRGSHYSTCRPLR